jgi:hypothetical protein
LSACPAPAQAPSNPGESLLERFYRLFRFPTIAVGMAAAAAVAVLLLYPPHLQQSILAVSSVPWEGIAKPKALPSSMKRIAVALTVKGFDPPLSEQKVDALYQALAPSMELQERFQVASPRAVKDSVGRIFSRPRDTKEALALVGSHLNVSVVAVTTVESALNGARVQTELIDPVSGRVQLRGPSAEVPLAELDRAVRESAFTLLLPAGKKD